MHLYPKVHKQTFMYLLDFLPAQYLRHQVYITRLDGLLVLFGPRGTFNVNQMPIVFIYETNAESDKYFLRVQERFVDFLAKALCNLILWLFLAQKDATTPFFLIAGPFRAL
jgi:hypothetical protein